MSTLTANFPATTVAAPRVSLIVAVRNGARYLERCLRAIAQSDTDDYEIIVVDDASTDDSASVAEAHGARVLKMPRRGGPGAARNLGVQAASAPVVFFADADVCIHPDSISRIVQLFDSQPQTDAIFGSYDEAPGAPNLISQYKNLFHRFVHQNSHAEASTFWSGCGAIRKAAFLTVGGFDVTAPSIEDIDLGVRLHKTGRNIRLDKSLQGKHLKTWRLTSLIRCDVIDRGIPWTRLILRERGLRNDLNLTTGQRLSALLACLTLCLTLLGSWWRPWLAAVPVLALLVVWIVDRSSDWSIGTISRKASPAVLWLGAVTLTIAVSMVLLAAGGWGVAIGGLVLLIIFLNRSLYHYYAVTRGAAFAILVVPLHLIYFLYSVASLLLGTLFHLLGTDNGANKWRGIDSDAPTRPAHGRSVSILARLESSRTRRRIYTGIVCAMFVLAWASQGIKSHQKHEALDFVVSDAEGYWVYLPSLIIDHNLTLTRNIQFHSTVHPIEAGSFQSSPQGLHNHWPVGVAMTLAPAFILAHGLSLVVFHWTGANLFAPNGYSLIYQLFGLLSVLAISRWAMAAIDQMLRRHFSLSGAAIVAGVTVCALGSNWAYYMFREPFMSHAIGAAWIILAIAAAQRLTAAAQAQRVDAQNAFALVFTLSMAVACRHTNVVMLPLAIWGSIVVVRAGLLARLARMIPLLLVAAAPIVIHLLVLRVMHSRQAPNAAMGGYAANESFNWLHPVLIKTLFSDYHGLFFWSPVLLLSVYGFAWHFIHTKVRFDGLLFSLFISFAALWYLNSAWYGWAFGKAFGARAFLDLIGIFVIGAALAFESLGHVSVLRRRVVLGSVGIAMLFNWILLFLFVANRIPRERPLF